MTRQILRVCSGLATVLAIVSSTWADEKPSQSKSTETPTKTPAVDKGKAPDFSGYVTVVKLTAEVISSNDTSATLRVFWLAKNQQKGRGNRPGISSGRSTVSPYSTRSKGVQVHWEHHDYEIPYVPESLVRTKTLPPKLEADGKKGYYSEKELDELKVPYTVPGYAASKSDLVKGTVVDAYVIRDKTIAADKVTDKDMRLRYVIIVGHDPNPPATPTPPKTTSKN